MTRNVVTINQDVELVICDHGHDVALGNHMCPVCDPNRPWRTTANAEPPQESRPKWIAELLESGQYPGLNALMNEGTTP